MFVCAIDKSFIDFGEDHDNAVFLNVRDRFIEHDNLVHLEAGSVLSAHTIRLSGGTLTWESI